MYHKILVALDRSPTRLSLLDTAITLAQTLQANLMLLHVLSAYDEASPGLPLRAYHASYPMVSSVAWESYQQHWEAYETEGRQQLQQLVAEASDRGVRAEFSQLAGDPGRVICDVAHSWDADLILVGHRGRAGLSELLLGSVSNYVMHHAPCSVLVSRSAAQPADTRDRTPATGTAA